MSKQAFIRVAALVGLVSVAALSSSDASACGGGIWTPPNEDSTVDTATWMVEAGQEKEAAELLSNRFWYIRGSLPHAKSASTIKRAVRALALASARQDGRVRVGAPYSFGPKAANQQNVGWAISRLRMLEKADPSSTTASNDLAEALVRNPATVSEGQAKLTALYEKGTLDRAFNHNELARSLAISGKTDEARKVAKACTASYGSSCISADVVAGGALAAR